MARIAHRQHHVPDCWALSLDEADNQPILIKSTREYSVELHDFCAQLGHAPPILAYEILPGGRRAIAMEFISLAALITRSLGLATHNQRWMAELLKLVEAFHGKDLVHGDLRDVNIICDNDGKMMLIDFDWGGMDGEVFYLSFNLNTELLEGRKSSTLKISKDDDIRVLKRTLEKLNVN